MLFNLKLQDPLKTLLFVFELLSSWCETHLECFTLTELNHLDFFVKVNTKYLFIVRKYFLYKHLLWHETHTSVSRLSRKVWVTSKFFPSMARHSSQRLWICGESSSFTGGNQSSLPCGKTIKKHNSTTVTVSFCQTREAGNKNLKECLYKYLGTSFIIIVCICALAPTR